MVSIIPITIYIASFGGVAGWTSLFEWSNDKNCLNELFVIYKLYIYMHFNNCILRNIFVPGE